MEYLLVMSLSGSTMIGIYLLLKWLLKDKVSARLYYLLIKEAVLFFLIPLPFLKGWYRQVIRTVIPVGQMKRVEIPVAWTRYVIREGEKNHNSNKWSKKLLKYRKFTGKKEKVVVE